MPKTKKWFIVVGRAYGDDEASAMRFHAFSKRQAILEFKDEVGDVNKKTEGPGYVWIDIVFDCGTTEPKVV